METGSALVASVLSKVRYQVPRYSGWKLANVLSVSILPGASDTKYRDIADGNECSAIQHTKHGKLETKYRDIADGNRSKQTYSLPVLSGWKPSTAI